MKSMDIDLLSTGWSDTGGRCAAHSESMVEHDRDKPNKEQIYVLS
jgi:hypothetical protein